MCKEEAKKPNGWNEWSKHVLAELKRLSEWNETMANTQQDILIQISALKVKAGVWGIFGGGIAVLIGLAVWMIKSAT